MADTGFDNSGHKYLLLNMPNDNNLVCNVNGKTVEMKTVFDGFILIPLSEGRNQIHISYRIPYFATGVVLSLISIAIITVLLVIEKKKTDINGNP